jgi:hypothetical protein
MAEYMEPREVQQSVTIFEAEPRESGLLDAKGNQLYRPAEPIGFIRKDTN